MPVSLFLFCKYIHLYHILHSTCKWYHILVCLCLTYFKLCIIISWSTQVATSDINSFFFHGQVIFDSVYISYSYPFTCLWTFRLFFCLDYCKKCCYKHWGALIFFKLYLFQFFIILLFFFKLFIYFWLCWVFVAAHGVSLIVASKGLLFILVHRLLIAVACPVGEHRL